MSRDSVPFGLISTHALREEGDCHVPDPGQEGADFYPRPPRGGRRSLPALPPGSALFLPTPSARRATFPAKVWVYVDMISTHALREEGDAGCSASRTTMSISTHALREEGDVDVQPLVKRLEFLPTPSARRATFQAAGQGRTRQISTHALREEGDGSDGFCHQVIPLFLPTPSARRATQPVSRASMNSCNFYPRPPRGGRHPSVSVFVVSISFLPTPSARRATADVAKGLTTTAISTHALREEGDGRR